MYIDVNNIFAKNKTELETIIQIISRDIGKEFGIKKYAMLIMKKEERRNRITQSEKYQNTLRKKNPTWNQLSSRNLIKGINTWAVSLVRYFRPFLNCKRKKLIYMGHRAKKLMTIHKAIHLIDNIDRLYVTRKEGRKLLRCNNSGIQRVYKKSKDRLITVTSNSNINGNNFSLNWKATKKNLDNKNRKKQLYRYFKWQIKEIAHEITWIWLWRGNLKRETESLIAA